MSEISYSVDWFSHNIRIWDTVFDKYELKNKDNLKFLEIGCFEGRSTNYLLDNILTGNNCTIDVVDTFEASMNETGMAFDKSLAHNLYDKFVNNVQNHIDKITIHRGKSGEILKKDFKENTFDFIYVDGSHTAYDVLQDAILCHPLLKLGGLIIFDDFGWKDPNNLDPTNSPEMGITFFYNCYKPFYEMVFSAYQVCLIRTK